MADRIAALPRLLQRRGDLLLPAAVLLLAGGLRAGWPTLTEFKFSEARLAALALQITKEGHLPLVGVPSSAGFDHSPLSVYLYVPAFLLTTNPIPATIYGGLMGVAAVFLCWWLSRHWPGGSSSAAWIAALLFAVGPWAVVFSRKIWQVTFVPFLTLAFIGLLISALVEKRQWRLAWALVFYALLVQVHPSTIALAPTLLLALLIFRREVRLRPLLAGAALGMLTGIPFLFHQLQHGWPVLVALRALPQATWDLAAVRLAWEAITGRGIHALAGDAYPLLRLVPQLGWTFNLVGWLSIGATLWLAWRAATDWRAADVESQKQARTDLVLLLWLIVPVVFNLRHSLDLHLHFFALVAPAAYLIIGRAAGTVLKEIPCWPGGIAVGRILGLAGIGLLALAQVVALVLMGHFVTTHDTPGGFGTPLSRYLAIVKQAVAVATEEDAPEMLVVGQGDSIVVDETPAIFDLLLRGRVSYRFVDGQSAALFPWQRTLVLLTPGAGEATEWYRLWPASHLQGGYRLVVLDGSWPQEGFASVTGPRLFQNGVEVQNYVWGGNAAPGGRIQLWLLWQVLWLNPDDTHFSIRLLDREGEQQGQQDAVGYPTAYRRKGDHVLSKFDITISPQAEPEPLWWAQVGLYFYPQVTNLPVVDQTGNPVASTVLIGPLGLGEGP